MIRTLLLLLVLPPTFALPENGLDRWGPFLDRRVVSPSGMRYAVVRKQGRTATFELVRRREGAPPMTAAIASRRGRGASIDRDRGDTVLGTGVLPQLPMDVRVLEDGGLVAFEQYARLGYGDVVTWVDPDGKVRTRVRLQDLFDEPTIKGFRHSVSSIWWYRGWWVDEARQRAVVVAHDGHLREVSLSTGRVAIPDPSVVWGVVHAGTQEERELALELCAQLKPKSVLVRTLPLAKDVSEPMGVRLRAALAAQMAHAPDSFVELFLAAARDEKVDIATRRYAVAHLADVMGEKALPVLREMLRGRASKLWAAAQDALVALGEAAVPVLIAMVAETDQSEDYRGAAAHVLRRLETKAAAAALSKTVADESRYVANAACNALITIAPAGLAETLAKHLAAGTTQDARIASWFTGNRHPAAKAALKKAARRHAPGTYEARTIDKAMKFQLGITGGTGRPPKSPKRRTT